MRIAKHSHRNTLYTDQSIQEVGTLFFFFKLDHTRQLANFRPFAFLLHATNGHILNIQENDERNEKTEFSVAAMMAGQ